MCELRIMRVVVKAIHKAPWVARIVGGAGGCLGWRGGGVRGVGGGGYINSVQHLICSGKASHLQRFGQITPSTTSRQTPITWQMRVDRERLKTTATSDDIRREKLIGRNNRDGENVVKMRPILYGEVFLFPILVNQQTRSQWFLLRAFFFYSRFRFAWRYVMNLKYLFCSITRSWVTLLHGV